MFPHLIRGHTLSRHRGRAGQLEHHCRRIGPIRKLSDKCECVCCMSPSSRTHHFSHADRILTDEMIAAIKAYFPRYPMRRR